MQANVIDTPLYLYGGYHSHPTILFPSQVGESLQLSAVNYTDITYSNTVY